MQLIKTSKEHSKFTHKYTHTTFLYLFFPYTIFLAGLSPAFLLDSGSETSMIINSSYFSRHSENIENYFERLVKNKFSCYSESIVKQIDSGSESGVTVTWKVFMKIVTTTVVILKA